MATPPIPMSEAAMEAAASEGTAQEAARDSVQRGQHGSAYL